MRLQDMELKTVKCYKVKPYNGKDEIFKKSLELYDQFSTIRPYRGHDLFDKEQNFYIVLSTLSLDELDFLSVESIEELTNGTNVSEMSYTDIMEVLSNINDIHIKQFSYEYKPTYPFHVVELINGKFQKRGYTTGITAFKKLDKDKIPYLKTIANGNEGHYAFGLSTDKDKSEYKIINVLISIVGLTGLTPIVYLLIEKI